MVRAVLGGRVAVGAMRLIIDRLGFKAAGVAAGSIAAMMMAAAGNVRKGVYTHATRMVYPSISIAMVLFLKTA